MTLVIFLAVLFILILVHEFGHFIVAKKSGIRVDEFGIGFPPKAFGKKFGETEYTFNWLPIGGFVRIWGEDPTEEHVNGPDSERSFVNKPRIIQAAVLVAGVTMNILLAFVLYMAAFMYGMPTVIEEEAVEHINEATVLVHTILPDSPAAQTMRQNDIIIGAHTDTETLTAEEAHYPSAISAFIRERGGQEITLEIQRRDEVIDAVIVPQAGVNPDHPEVVAAGFIMTLVVTEKLSFFEAAHEAFSRTVSSLVAITVGLWDLAGQALHGTADYTQVAGPVGIVGLVGDAAALGLSWLLIFTAFISLNLAVINLLPIPALDGGRLLFVVIEAITRRPIKPVIATRVNQAGFVLLLSLMFLITVHDVLKLFN